MSTLADFSSDDLCERFTAWRESKRFVVAGPVISSQQPLQRDAGRAAKSPWSGRRAFLRAWPAAPGRWQRLFGFLRAAVARWRTPGRPGR